VAGVDQLDDSLATPKGPRVENPLLGGEQELLQIPEHLSQTAQHKGMATLVGRSTLFRI
jgi:hypothetical protein